MALLERITTLVRANLNELADRAEQPVPMMKQLVLDMENQLLQVKTQVAMTLADLHILQRKQTENLTAAEQYTRKAELALEKGEENLARAALAKRLAHEEMSPGYQQQIADQQTQVENLKSALGKLDGKLTEARAKVSLLIAEERRARTLAKAVDAVGTNGSLKRVEEKIQRASAISQARAGLLSSDSEEQLDHLVKEDKIDRMLLELKAGRTAPPRLTSGSED